MADMRPSNRPVELVPKTDANPEGKGVNGFLADWRATEPRGIVAKPQRQVLAELFTSMLVLSSAFKYRPAQGRPNYLYCIDGQWSLSLIAPEEWTSERRDGFAGTCTLQHDMTWTILPSERLATDSPVSAEIRRFFAVFAEMLNTEHGHLIISSTLPPATPSASHRRGCSPAQKRPLYAPACRRRSPGP